MMGSDYSSSGHKSRRGKYDDKDLERERDRNRRHRDEDSDIYRRRDRSRSKDRGEDMGRDWRRRSKTPDSGRHRSRDGERNSLRDKPRDRRRNSPSDRRARRHRDRDRDHDRDSELDDHHRERRRRRSPDDGAPRRISRKDADAEDDDMVGRSGGRSLVRRGGPLPSQGDSFAVSKGEEPEKPKEKPNFGNTGVLAAASNSMAQADGSTITLKYHEPAEARKPSPRDQWKLFVFKGSDIVDTIELSTRSCWLVGREVAVVDLPAEHPSISKQHAVIQFRYVEKRNDYGDKIGKVKPYLIDLESANGTSLNGKKVPDSRYLELKDKDMVKFGLSTREYVLMLAPKE